MEHKEYYYDKYDWNFLLTEFAKMINVKRIILKDFRLNPVNSFELAEGF